MKKLGAYKPGQYRPSEEDFKAGFKEIGIRIRIRASAVGHCVFGSRKGFRQCLPPKAASETLPIRSQRETSAVVRELSRPTRSAMLGPRFRF